MDGYALATVGHQNTYFYAVFSDLEDYPGGDEKYMACDTIEAYETLTIEVELGASRPGVLAVSEADLTGGAAAEMTLSASWEVESHRVVGDGGYFDRQSLYWFGSYTVEGAAGRLDQVVVDQANLDLLVAGEAFQAMGLERDMTSATLDLDLPGDLVWYLVLYNPAFSSHQVGTLEAVVAPVDGVSWTGEVEPVETRFRIPPREYLAVELAP